MDIEVRVGKIISFKLYYGLPQQFFEHTMNYLIIMRKTCLPLLGTVLLFSLSSKPANCQSGNWTNVPTPNAASLGQYGDIPVNYFNGLASIGVPIWETKCSGQSIPINLSYHGGGIKADEHPGTCGLGWTLLAGGAITRKVNTGPDEYVCAVPSLPQYQGYYYTGGKLTDNSWSSFNFLLSAKTDYPSGNNPSFIDDGEPDEFSFNFLNHSGKFFLDENKVWHVASSDNLSYTIEEQRTNDFELTDVLNPVNKIKLKSIFSGFVITAGDGYKFYFGGNASTIEFSRGAFNNASITPDGYAQYVTPISWYLTKIQAPDGQIATFNYERGEPLFEKRKYRTEGTLVTDASGVGSVNVVSEGITGSVTNPVYLKKITTALQDINFSYTTSIEKRYINFSNLEDNHLANSINANLLYWTDFLTTRANLGPHDELLPHTYRQLNEITVAYKSGNVGRKISFDYDNDIATPAATSRRLTLYKLTVKDASGNISIPYRFEYNHVDLLPDYGLRRSDHWGYFNDVDYMAPGANTYTFDSWRQADPVTTAYGILNKIVYPTGGSTSFVYEPHTYARYVNVTSNPTSFLYALSLVNEGTNRTAGGLRIKKIISSPGYGGVDKIKEYKYEQTGSSLSSGILAGIPFYQDILRTNSTACHPDACYSPAYGGIWTFNQKSDNTSYNPISLTKGSHVTYSEVREVLADGSYTQYRYSNYDIPNCMDETHTGFAQNSHTIYNLLYKISSKEVERGLLLNSRTFSNTGALISEEAYEYVNDQLPASSFAKAVSSRIMQSNPIWPCGQGVAGCQLLAGTVWAHKYYYYNKLLQKVKQTLYTPNPVVSTKEYVYDQYRNITQTTTVNSEGQSIIDATRYNSDPVYLGNAVSPEAIGIKRLFTIYKITNLPVEQTSITTPATPVLGGNVMTAGTLYCYNSSLPILDKTMRMELAAPFKPITFSGSTVTYNYVPSGTNASGNFEYDSRYRLQESVTSSATNSNMVKGRPLAVKKRNEDEVYTWDYRSQFLTSVTRNATIGNTAYTSFEGDYQVSFPLDADGNTGFWDFNKDYISSPGIGGNKSLNLPLGSGTTLTTVSTLQNGKKYILSFWYKGNCPKLRNGSTAFGGSFAAAAEWTFVELPFTGNGGQLSFVAPSSGVPFVSCYVDEVRLYPEGASMKTYTYDALSGSVTSEGSENGDLRLYRYDNLNRLIDIRDSKGYILKTFSYQIQRPQ